MTNIAIDKIIADKFTSVREERLKKVSDRQDYEDSVVSMYKGLQFVNNITPLHITYTNRGVIVIEKKIDKKSKKFNWRKMSKVTVHSVETVELLHIRMFTPDSEKLGGKANCYISYCTEENMKYVHGEYIKERKSKTISDTKENIITSVVKEVVSYLVDNWYIKQTSKIVHS